MSEIKNIKAKEILDSRGNPTVQVEVYTTQGVFSASVPSGASTGEYEAVELRDGDKNRYNGKGVLKAIENIEKIILPALKGKNSEKQKEIDELMIKLDGTKNKSRLGANAILSVSMAICKAGAFSKNMKLYEYIAELAGNKKIGMPVPFFNVINGGRHAKNNITFQEFMIAPVEAESFQEAFQIGKKVYDQLKEIIRKKYGSEGLVIGDEGGFAPKVESNEEGLELLKEAIGKEKRVRIAIDVAASEFFREGKYILDFKDKSKIKKTGEELIKTYEEFIKKYNILSIEDPFEQNDWKTYEKFYSIFGNKMQIVGDDLLVTNVNRIKEAIEKKACNALLLKINQIGTITEAINAFQVAKKAGWKIMVSHRSGETQEDFIADLVVGLGTGEIKAGAPFKPERLAKYNRLLEIEKELKDIKYARFS